MRHVTCDWTIRAECNSGQQAEWSEMGSRFPGAAQSLQNLKSPPRLQVLAWGAHENFLRARN